MADNILPSLPSEHFPTGGKHYLCSVVANYDGCARRWLELDLQRWHLFHRRNRAYRATTNDVRQVLARLGRFRAKVASPPRPGGELLRQTLAGPVRSNHWGCTENWGLTIGWYWNTLDYVHIIWCFHRTSLYDHPFSLLMWKSSVEV